MLQLIFWLSGIFSKKKRSERRNSSARLEEKNKQLLSNLNMKHTRAKLTLTDIKDDGVGFKPGSFSELRNPPDLMQWEWGQWSAFTSMMRDCSTDGCFCLFWKWSLKQHQDPHDVDRWLHGCRGLGYHTSAWSSTWGQNSHQWLNPLSPIKYGEWHQLFIDMRDRYVAMVLWSYQGPCVKKTESRG